MNKEELEKTKKELKNKKSFEVWEELKEMEDFFTDYERGEHRYYEKAEAFYSLLFDAIKDFLETTPIGVKKCVYLTPDWHLALEGDRTHLQEEILSVELPLLRTKLAVLQ